MNLAVWKYRIPGLDEFTLNLPVGAMLLHVGVQDEQPQLWALVDTEEVVLEQRSFRLAGTGHPITAPYTPRPVGSFMLAGGALVFHLFEMEGV